MILALIIAVVIVILEGVALGVILSPWGQQKIVSNVLRASGSVESEISAILARWKAK